jgi:hypothetical protein
MTAFVGRSGASLGALAAALAVALTCPALASDYKPLDESQLRDAITGKTVRLETSIGAIPISFRADGTMTGRSTDLANYLGRSYDTGSWWIDSNQLCQKWKLWMDAKPYCFSLRQAGTKVQWTRSDGMKGMLTVSN